MSAETQSARAKRALLEKYLRNAAQRPGVSAATIAPRPADQPIPLSIGQQQLWFLSQLLGGAPAYNEIATVHIPGPLNVPTLEASFEEVLRRHEAWRTTFALVDGQPVQRVQPPGPVSLPLVDLTTLSPAGREAEALRLAREAAIAPFDITAAPPWRVVLVRLADDSYRLYLAIHHIIFDGYAVFQVFLSELSAIYDSLCAGQAPSLPPPPITYGDYAHWQHQPEQAAERTRRMAYWRSQLAAPPSAIDLPTDHPRPALQTFRGAVRQFEIPSELVARLRSLGQREGATLYMVMLSALKVLLHRHTGQTDITIGTASSGRDRSELQGLLGLFLNTLVLRTDLGGNPSFLDLLRRVRETTIAATANEVPFETLVQELRPERDLGRNPYFQVLITLEPDVAVNPLGWTLTTQDVTTDTSKFDLSLKLDDRASGLTCRFEYNTDLFDPATIDRLVGHFLTLLAGIVADPAQAVATLPFLPEEQQAELRAWNATGAPFSARGIHEQVAAQAALTPAAPAIFHNGRTLTYAALEARANQLARYLRAIGVAPGTLVALAADRSAEMVVGLLGILKAGGAYLPLDPAFPADRLAFILEDAAVAVLVTQRPLIDRLPSTGARIVCLDADWPAIAREDDAPVDCAATPDDLAYAIYTSGSTGKPKGVLIPHRAAVNFLAAMVREPGITADDTLVAVTTLSFDIHVLELWLPLIVGARVVLADRATVTDGPRLAALIRDTGATVVQATPAAWRMLIAAGWSGNRRLKLLCGGEALPRALADQLLDRCGELWNMYGPTETTVWSSVLRVGRGTNPVPVGGPIANTTFHVLNGRRQPLPVGVFGELVIGGAGVAFGYLNRPGLTAERFIPDPFGQQPGARLYRTGDRVRWRPEGTLEFSGRLDFQVKIRGYRIELGEIEAALLGHPAVRAAVVVAREETPGEARLVAYVTPRAGQEADPADLRAALRLHLPDYMVPAAFVVLATLPLTPNGKVDRRALPAPEQAAPGEGRGFVGPRDATELQLTRIWEEVLGVRPIGVTANFFDLGGHSLLAVRLFARIAAEFGHDLPLATLFQAPTIADLAGFLRDGGRAASWSSLVPLQPHGALPPFFCIHPIGGNVLSFRDLARQIGPDQPIYGLQARGLSGREAPDTHVETMAAHYIDEVRRLQPTGPYYIGGQCFGGMVALEVAQQLQAAGETVGLLAMFDNYAPGYTKLLSRRANVRLGLRWFRQRAGIHLDVLRQLELREVPRYLALRARTVALRTRNRLWQGALQLFEEVGRPLPERLQNVRQACLLAQRAYVPRLYHGRPLLFVVQERQEAIDPDPQFGWGDLATDGVAVYEVPGDHKTMWREPNVQVLAATLNRCLAEARERLAGRASAERVGAEDVLAPHG